MFVSLNNLNIFLLIFGLVIIHSTKCNAKIFQIDGVLLMKKGVAEGMVAKEGGKRIIDFIKEAKEAGVEMRVCSAALQLHDMAESDLIDECDGVVGAAYMVDIGMDSAMVLNY